MTWQPHKRRLMVIFVKKETWRISFWKTNKNNSLTNSTKQEFLLLCEKKEA